MSIRVNPAPVGGARFHCGILDAAEATRPLPQLGVAGGGGRELAIGQRAAVGGDDRGVVGLLMGVDSEY
ncbi:hypothetical protein O4159_24255, partial [Gordonia terrae]|nr:hypothetical protein [Gordonia terrae]